MGLCAALFVLLVTVTGVLLNHTVDFQFDSNHVKSDWVLNWYGIDAPEQMLSFAAGERSITLMGEHLYLDRREIDGEYRNLVGALHLQEFFVVAVSNNILLLTPRGELVERLQPKDGVPAGMQSVGVDRNGKLVIQGSHDLYQTDADFLGWKRWEGDRTAIRWSVPAPLDPQLKIALQNHYRGEVLPMERVLLDLHSGRFFGRFGPWVIDAAAILMALLALSGTWIWLKRRR